jgi:hypothetical protein
MADVNIGHILTYAKLVSGVNAEITGEAAC